jgi:predicted ester cyclase
MTIETLDTLYCRFVDSVINRRRLEDLDEFMAADVVDHTPRETVGIDTARQTLERWLEVLPDLHLVIEDVVVDGERIMARLTATGTHARPQGGLEPTGRRVRLAVFEAWATSDGRCVERWLHLDRYDLLRQLGLESSVSFERDL